MPLNSCDQCDFKCESNKGLKIHMGKMHEEECPECNELFGGELKLKTHMCRVHVANPSFKHFYMKNWFVRESCISILCKQQNKEVALLHNEHCTRNCEYYPQNLAILIRVDDENDLIHLKSTCYLESGRVCWQKLTERIEGKDIPEVMWMKMNDKANA